MAALIVYHVVLVGVEYLLGSVLRGEVRNQIDGTHQGLKFLQVANLKCFLVKLLQNFLPHPNKVLIFLICRTQLLTAFVVLQQSVRQAEG